MDKTHLDSLFEKVNNLSADSRNDSKKAIDIAVRGFIAIENIYNLIPYKDFELIEEAIKEYMEKVENYTKK